MDFDVIVGKPDTLESACLIAGVYSDGKSPASTAALDKASGGLITKLTKNGDFKGERGQTLLLVNVEGVAAKRVLLTGLGKAADFDRGALTKATQAALTALKSTQVKQAIALIGDADCEDVAPAQRVRMIVEACIDAQYRFDKNQITGKKSKKSDSKKISLSIRVTDRRQEKTAARAIRDGEAIGHGRSLAKDLGNLPGNICTPTYLANRAKDIGKQNKSVKVTVYDEARMKKLGMRTLLSVSRGSREPAQLIQMEYNGGRKNGAPVVLIGKGITFDTGGISLKPGATMDEMKFDMCGAASVIGTMQAIAAMGLKLNVVGLVAASENMPDGAATKPGDIIESMSGQTVEILNTDAEGRLVLCDTLTFSERFKPQAVIDIATLTGACVVALGAPAAGLFTNHQALADDLSAAGDTCGDRVWQLPIWKDYQRQLDSNFADMANIGGRAAGAITAACFLARFAENLKWAHLDIAGSAWLSGTRKGSTGRPVGLLTQYLMNTAKH